MIGPESGNEALLLCEKVRSTPLTLLPPPASDISITFPPGPTNRTSRSSGNTWETSFKLTDTLTTAPVICETEMVEGYGDAGAPAGKMIGVALVNAAPWTGRDTAATSQPKTSSIRGREHPRWTCHWLFMVLVDPA